MQPKDVFLMYPSPNEWEGQTKTVQETNQVAQCTRFYILLRISFSAIRFSRCASFFVDPGLVVSVVFSPVIIVSFDSVLGNLVTVSLLSITTDSVILILCSVCLNVVVSGDVYGAVVVGGGHVNTPTFLELQIRSLTEVQKRKIMQSLVSNSKQRTKQNLAIKELR